MRQWQGRDAQHAACPKEGRGSKETAPDGTAGGEVVAGVKQGERLSLFRKFWYGSVPAVKDKKARCRGSRLGTGFSIRPRLDIQHQACRIGLSRIPLYGSTSSVKYQFFQKGTL